MSNIAGRVGCKQSEQFIGVTPAFWDDLLAGRIPCPICSVGGCGAIVTQVDFVRELSVVSWDGSKWAPGLIYKVDVGSRG